MKTLFGTLIPASMILAGCASQEKPANYQYGSADGKTVISASAPGTYSTGSPSSSTYPGTGTTYPSGYTYSNSTYSASVYTTDDSLLRQIRQELTGYGRLGTIAQSLQIEAQNGVVTLSGSVPTQQDHDMITAAVRNTPGVVSVTDQLQTSNTPTGSSSRVYSGTQATSAQSLGSGAAGEIFSLNVQGLTAADRTLAQRIMSGLEADSALPNLLPKVNINIGDGRVVLKGTVQNEQQRRFIEDAVRRAAGVSSVEDQLQITGP